MGKDKDAATETFAALVTRCADKMGVVRAAAAAGVTPQSLVYWQTGARKPFPGAEPTYRGRLLTAMDEFERTGKATV